MNIHPLFAFCHLLSSPLHFTCQFSIPTFLLSLFSIDNLSKEPSPPHFQNNRGDPLLKTMRFTAILHSGFTSEMPFYRILLVTRNDLAVASIYNKFVETAKYVINNGGVFQRIYNTGNQLFRYCSCWCGCEF